MTSTAIYTKTVMDKDEPYKPASITVSHRRQDGTWHRETGFDYHHGAPNEYSHSQAVQIYRYRHPAIDSNLREMHFAPAYDGKHDFIFI